MKEMHVNTHKKKLLTVQLKDFLHEMKYLSLKSFTLLYLFCLKYFECMY